jgi:hypothetical protein
MFNPAPTVSRQILFLHRSRDATVGHPVPSASWRFSSNNDKEKKRREKQKIGFLPRGNSRSRLLNLTGFFSSWRVPGTGAEIAAMSGHWEC